MDDTPTERPDPVVVAIKDLKDFAAGTIMMRGYGHGTLDAAFIVERHLAAREKQVVELRKEVAYQHQHHGDHHEENIRLLTRLDALRAVINQCAVQFRQYEQLHLAKTPPDPIKARVNAVMSEFCEKALAAP